MLPYPFHVQPPWDDIGPWVRDCLPRIDEIKEASRVLDKVCWLIDQELDYDVREIIKAGSFACDTALGAHLDSELVVFMREFEVPMVSTDHSYSFQHAARLAV